LFPRWRRTSSNRIERCHASTQYSNAVFAPKNGHGENAAADFFDPTCTSCSGIIAPNSREINRGHINARDLDLDQRTGAKSRGESARLHVECVVRKEDHPRAGAPMHFLRIADFTFVTAQA
jgi:hypothetical protein